jgi:hypothetical protein
MKKFLINLVIAFGMVLPSKASQVNLSNRISGIESYSDSINYNSLGKYLDLNAYQMYEVKEVQGVFYKELKKVNNLEDEKKKVMIDNVIKFNLRNMKSILTGVQYRKFLKVFNATLNNRNIKQHVSES